MAAKSAMSPKGEAASASHQLPSSGSESSERDIIKSVDVRRASVEQHPGTTGLAICLPQHADQHCPERPVLLAVDQELDLDRWLAVRRGLSVRPMTRGDAETADPMHVETTLCAVQRPGLELALDVGFHLEQLKPKHLRVDRDRVIASTSGLRLVNELIGLDGLLGNGVDGVL
jgi:hypothetical protein